MSINPLDGCVANIAAAVSFLKSANSRLESGTEDLARLSTILQTRQVFDIVSEPEVLKARDEVVTAIEPQVLELQQKVESELKKLERKEKSLLVKAESELGRLVHIGNVVEAKKEKKAAAAAPANAKDSNTTKTSVNTEATTAGHKRKRSSTKKNNLADEKMLEQLKELKEERDRLLYAKTLAALEKKSQGVSRAIRKH